MFRIAVVAAFCLICSAVGAHAQQAAASQIKTNIPYGPDPAQQLDICLPAAPPSGRPAVVLIHGGYWISGDKGMYAQLCKGAADQGIVAMSIGYRLATGDPHNRWPAQLVDAQLAVRWLRSHASEYGVDPNRICAWGDSAGGQLAVFLAALDHTMPGDYAGVLSGVSPKVACAVDNFGPVDLSADNYWPPIQQLFGAQDRSQSKDQERSASPLFLIGPGTAPIMVAHGKDDKSVNIDQSMHLADRLKSAHVPVKMVVTNGGHEFEGLTMQQMVAIFEQELMFVKAAPPR